MKIEYTSGCISDRIEIDGEAFDYKEAMKRKELISKVIKLESEVDEYLKKMDE